MFDDSNPEDIPDSDFIDYVVATVDSAKKKGATHALLHVGDTHITNYVALEIDDVARAYRSQMKQWPERSRSSKAPTLWFEDSRVNPAADCISGVLDLELPLSAICGLSELVKGKNVDSKKMTAEVEFRMRQ